MALLVLAACSSLPDAGNGIVGLEIQTPDAAALTLMVGDTVRLHARALNLHGDPVAADIIWRTPDTTLITIDSLQGLVTSIRDTSTTARVQASVGSLVSGFILVTLRAVPASILRP